MLRSSIQVSQSESIQFGKVFTTFEQHILDYVKTYEDNTEEKTALKPKTKKKGKKSAKGNVKTKTLDKGKMQKELYKKFEPLVNTMKELIHNNPSLFLIPGLIQRANALCHVFFSIEDKIKTNEQVKHSYCINQFDLFMVQRRQQFLLALKKNNLANNPPNLDVEIASTNIQMVQICYHQARFYLERDPKRSQMYRDQIKDVIKNLAFDVANSALYFFYYASLAEYYCHSGDYHQANKYLSFCEQAADLRSEVNQEPLVLYKIYDALAEQHVNHSKFRKAIRSYEYSIQNLLERQKYIQKFIEVGNAGPGILAPQVTSNLNAVNLYLADNTEKIKELTAKLMHRNFNKLQQAFDQLNFTQCQLQHHGEEKISLIFKNEIHQACFFILLEQHKVPFVQENNIIIIQHSDTSIKLITQAFASLAEILQTMEVSLAPEAPDENCQNNNPVMLLDNVEEGLSTDMSNLGLRRFEKSEMVEEAKKSNQASSYSQSSQSSTHVYSKESLENTKANLIKTNKQSSPASSQQNQYVVKWNNSNYADTILSDTKVPARHSSYIAMHAKLTKKHIAIFSQAAVKEMPDATVRTAFYRAARDGRVTRGKASIGKQGFVFFKKDKALDKYGKEYKCKVKVKSNHGLGNMRLLGKPVAEGTLFIDGVKQKNSYILYDFDKFVNKGHKK